MKIIIYFLSLASMIFFSTGCRSTADKTIPSFDSIKTYKDIPGITDDEISAIEALKTDKGALTYGSKLGTELFILPDGSYAGFTKEFCALLTKLFGIRFTPKIYELNELIENLGNRSLDFTGELMPTDERTQKYFMTSLSIAERMLRIFQRVDSVQITSAKDMDRLKIGFLAGTVTADNIKRIYSVTFTAVYVDNYHTAASMIKNGEIDLFIEEAVADTAFDGYDYITSSVFSSLLYNHVSMATGNPELISIINVVDKYIAAGGSEKLYEMYKEGDFEYAKYKLSKSFTDEERAYIDDLKLRRKSVSVAFESDNYPANFYNENDKKFEGIAVDVLAEISRLTDIRFVPANAKDVIWSDLMKKTIKGEALIIAELLYSEDRKENFIWSAVPYSYSYYAIMSRTDYPDIVSHQIAMTSVGVVRNTGHEGKYREFFPENDNLIKYDTMKDSLDALEKGEVDLLMASEHMLLTQTNYREKSGFKINLKLNAPMDSYFGFTKNETVLCSIISKAQHYVPTEMIETRWKSRIFDYSKKLAEERSFYLTIFILVLLLGLISSLFLLVRNIKLSKKLKKLATKDALTNISNRRYFIELVSTQLERSKRTKRECFLIIFDLDHFKAVNDIYGHLAGDKVLKETAQRVRSSIRKYDYFGRYGGEEFVVFMTEIDKSGVINATERIRMDICGEPVEFEDKRIPISASFGIAYAAPANDIDEATKYADKALYAAKEGGRNRVVFYDGNE